MSGQAPLSLRTRLLVIAGASVLGLLLAEGLVRVSGVAPSVEPIQVGRFRLSANPTLEYEPVPALLEGDEGGDFAAYEGFANSLGFRDYEHSVESDGAYRIAVLGDSIAAGLHVAAYEDTFPSLIEADLRRRGMRAEVLNFAVSGYKTVQEVEMLRTRGLAFDPDLVLLAYSLNDHQKVDTVIVRTLRELQLKRNVVDEGSAPPWLIRSALYRVVRYVLFESFRDGDDGSTRRPLAEHDLEAPFGRLAELARNQDFRVLVTVFPRFHGLSAYAWEAEHRLVADASARHGFLHLDLLERYRKCRTGGPRLSRDTWHPTAYGHRCAATEIADFIYAAVGTYDS
jgi:hypothetical protein